MDNDIASLEEAAIASVRAAVPPTITRTTDTTTNTTADEKEKEKEEPQTQTRTQTQSSTASSHHEYNNKDSSESSHAHPHSNSKTNSKFSTTRFSWPSFLAWIPSNLTFAKLKPVIRVAIVAWVSGVLFVIPEVEGIMGQATFLILIAAFLSPPSDPFMAVLEREVLILLFVCIAWGWSALGVKLADLSRTIRDPKATLASAVDGRYLEPAPTIIIAIFIFLGSAFFLYIKARQGPGPYLFACVFACICMDISLTTAVLLPFPFYKIGQSVAIPLSLHAALSILSSVLIFPSTISAQYTMRLQAVLTPLIAHTEMHISLLRPPSFSQSSPPPPTLASINASTAACESALIPLAASARLLGSDLIWCRFSPADWGVFQAMARRVAGKANGMGVYFSLVDGTRERFPGSRVGSRGGSRRESREVSREGSREGSRVGSREGSRVGSRQGSLERLDIDEGGGEGVSHSTPLTPTQSQSASASISYSLPPHQHLHHHHHHHSLLHTHTPPTHIHHAHGHGHGHGHKQGNLLHLAMTKVQIKKHHHRQQQQVGVFESQRYMDLEERRYADPNAEMYTKRTTELLSQSCEPLLLRTKESLQALHTWLGGLRTGRLSSFWKKRGERERAWDERVMRLERVKEELVRCLGEFRTVKRHLVLDPYRPAFEHPADGDDAAEVAQIPPHRHLFNCYTYQYHLMGFVDIVISMLDHAIKLEKERRHLKIWTPVQRVFSYNPWNVADNSEHVYDDDPDVIQGVDPNMQEDLGLPKRRDPDAMPPRNALEWVMNQVYLATASFSHGNTLYAVKAGVFTVLLCLPLLIKNSSRFAYDNRSVWAVIMGQLTLARFRGETVFGVTVRIGATFLGGAVGAAMWYISCGNTQGNPYGLAAVFAVFFPFFAFARVYYPGSPMTVIMFLVTASLVVGYSYQDIHLDLPGAPGLGISVAWRRFVLVTTGVVGAFIISYLPPTTTIRKYQRNLLSTTMTEIGAIYCSIITYATAREEHAYQEIITSLVAVRNKVKQSMMLRTNVVYEFSLRGRWPAKRYTQIMELQLQLAYSLTHLTSVVEHLEPKWSRAFLSRTRFLDPDFQGDVLAVISMISSSLRGGNPLPQITPCPLLDRFLSLSQGLEVISKESEEDFGLPRFLTLETLEDEQYLIFCVGIATAVGIVNRLDRLMLAAKEVVGEQYHIHGVGLSLAARQAALERGNQTSNATFRPPRDV